MAILEKPNNPNEIKTEPSKSSKSPLSPSTTQPSAIKPEPEPTTTDHKEPTSSIPISGIKPDPEPESDTDTLDALEREAKAFDKDSEISRILSAFRLDAYSVLNLQPGVPLSTITKTYRTLSLLIHPDKTTNPSAPDAFDRLKKAQTELSDDKARARLDECIADARFLLMREHGWTVDSEELRTEAFRREWREKTKFVLVEAEARRRRQVKGQLREEGREMVRVEAEVEGRKRKREWEQKWEESREGRVGSWREFTKKGQGGEAEKEKGRDDVVGVERKVKKKSKLKVLG